MTAKATVDSVRLDMISEMEINFPESKVEQGKIASVLWEIAVLMCVTVFFVHNQGANLSTFYYCFFVLWLVLFPSFILANRRILSGRYYYSMMDNCLYDLGQDNMILASRYKRQD